MNRVSRHLHKGGFAFVRKIYDMRGRLTEETLFDPEGKPARDDDGYVKLKYAYDDRGYRIEKAYYDEHDQLTFHTDGYAKERSKYNDRGQLLEIAFVDPDGAFVLHKKLGYAKARWTYNERGKVESLTRFDSQDQLMQTINGYAVSRYVYDDYGRETQRVFLDLNGAPVHTRVTIQDVEPDRNSQRLGFRVGDRSSVMMGKTCGTHTYLTSSSSSKGNVHGNSEFCARANL